MMRLLAKQFGALAGTTALEILRQPVGLLMVLSTVSFIAVMPLLILHTLGDTLRLVRDSALALTAVSGLLWASLAACGTLRREIEQGTAAAILSKPISRDVFFLAKFAGLALVLVLYVGMASLATLLAMRTGAASHWTDWWGSGPLLAAIPLALGLGGAMNFFTHRPFMSNAFVLLVCALVLAFLVSALRAPEPGMGLPLWPSAVHMAPAFFLLLLMLLVLGGLALSLAAHWNAQVTTTVLCVIFFLGLVADYALGRHAAAWRPVAVLYGLVPNWQHFWVANALGSQEGVPWSYVGHAVLYALLYLGGVLSLGLAGFRHVELKA